MKYLELTSIIKNNLFTFLDVSKVFPQEKEEAIRTQLHRFVSRGLITPLKRGVYCFDKNKIDELELAGFLYQPSYISLETALNYYGIIPDIPANVTSVTTVTTKKIVNRFGVFYYVKIKPELFFGFEKKGYFNLAVKEKALLDYFYLRKIRQTADLRLNLDSIDGQIYHKFAGFFPPYVRLKI